MDVRIEEAGPCRKTLHVVAAADDIAGDYKEIVDTFASRGRLPGFRRGKAPRELVERRFAPDIAEAVKERVVPRLYHRAIEDKKLTVLTVVDVRDVTYGRDAGLSFDVLVDVPPDFKLPRYHKVSLKREQTDVGDEQVEEAMGSLLDSHARYETDNDGAIGEEDFVKVDYRGEQDGRPLAETVSGADQLAKGEGFWVAVGSAREFIPGLAEALKGAAVGDSRTFDAVFPEDYAVEPVRGLTVTYHVTVGERRTRQRPELTAAFLKQFEVETEDALRARVREDLERAADQRETARLKEEIGKFLLGKTKFDLPQSVVEEETRGMVRNIVENVMRQGASREQVQEQRDRILESASQASRDRVKLSFVLARIAEEENITVADEDVDTALEGMAARYGMLAEQLKAELEKNNGLERLRSDLRSEKTMDFLLQEAKVK